MSDITRLSCKSALFIEQTIMSVLLNPGHYNVTFLQLPA